MAATHKDSVVKIMIKNLCSSFGWSYGVFWSFDHPNSILSTMQDAYFEDEFQGLIDDLLLQSPMLGGGLIGQAAFTKKHLWMNSEDNYIGESSSGSIWDMFQDNSKFCGQFSSGIKTIAAIPVEPQGVLQFGSTNKIPENTDFINQTKTMFNEIVNGNLPTISSSSPNGMFASLIPSQDSYFGSMFVDNNQSTTELQPSIGSGLTSFKEPLQDMFDFDSPTDFGIMDEFFQTGDFNISQWYPQSPMQSNVTLNDQLSSQSTGFLPVSFDEKVKPLTISGIDVDLFGNTGDLGDIVTPVMNDNRLRSDSFNLANLASLARLPESKSTQSIENDWADLPPKKGLFSNLGIKELFEGISGTSTSCVEDQVSSGSKRRKTDNPIWETGPLQPAVYNKNLGQKSEPVFKSEPWLGDGYSMDGSSTLSQAKKQVEPTKPTKKKAKPGTRPRPKDRQMILDRMAELRELIPNGEKMSIDCLLDRTIKHMLFLQSVTKHADRIKQVDEPKYNGVIQNNHSNDPNNSGVTWACEVGNQTMSCPLIVEDLSTTGQMLIEMICEQHGFFLEIVDVIRGFGLTILKGVMESREEKIWARFIVEAEAKRHVTRHELFAALVQLLQTMGSNDNHLEKKIMQTGNSLVNDFHHSGIQLPVSFADTGYGMNL
ncbi:putative transcription factor bHLH family [Helianthus annuus]|uniref:Putative myc-type, basic helix-loop-helix (BHLH) domain, Transcription factor MYC/MYB N-terminal n=1 Tax=Helianthus annuus TaxID=4232 RepID=A0A251RL02_HELAN|nr:transcription factor bHLH157 [Helianthus annuus]KAF5753446.1 putative transcription factor bHLH family [Helianthus annuus]KAJ0427527.1 putative transcription factor bHLH family [Helianthus annuus]KAJ0445809.1 putative transcription factor bHLH family [Helianthus annuus]